jgi:hypothetical protein
MAPAERAWRNTAEIHLWCGYVRGSFFLGGGAILQMEGAGLAGYFSPKLRPCGRNWWFFVLFSGFGLAKTHFVALFFKRGYLLDFVVCVFGGTNLFHYATREMGMSHVWSFFLLSALVWHIPRWYERPNWQGAALLGVILGWAVLIRPTNAVVGLLVLLWEVYSCAQWAERLRFYRHNLRLLPVAAAAAFLMFIPQLLYWKKMTGHWVRYSYTDESFIYWKAPKIAEVLFDVQNGLFIYSPMALLMVIGLFRGLWQRAYSSPALLAIFAISTYLFASWWAWWFGGAFGHRCYVELYALFAIPLGGLLTWAARSTVLVQTSMQLLTLCLVAYSVRLSFLYNILPGPWDGKDWWWNWDKLWWIYAHLWG